MLSEAFWNFSHRIQASLMESELVRRVMQSDVFRDLPDIESLVPSHSVFEVEDVEKFQTAFPALSAHVEQGSLVLCDSYANTEDPDFHQLAFSLLGGPDTGVDREPISKGFSLASNALEARVSGAKACNFPMEEAGLSEVRKIEIGGRAALVAGYSLPLPENVAA